jgi:exoribonuclease II
VSKSLSNSCLVTYDQDNNLIMGFVKEIKKNRVVVLNERGHKLELPEDRLSFLVNIKELTLIGSDKDLGNRLKEVKEEALAEIVEDLSSELWEFLVDEPEKEYTELELADLYFGNQQNTTLVGLRFRLASDKIFFKRTKTGYIPRRLEVVENLKQVEKQNSHKRELKDQLIRNVLTRLDDTGDKSLDYLNDPFYPQLKLLIDLVAKHGLLDGPREKEGKQLLQEIKTLLGKDWMKYKPQSDDKANDDAFSLLIAMKVFEHYENLSLHKYDFPLSWSEEAQAELEVLTSLDWNISQLTNTPLERQDLTNLESFTIDDFYTKDMDDALSFQFKDDGFEFGIHIADVANLLLPNTSLDKEAKQRATSIYCPDGAYNMLPRELSEHLFSLKPNELRPSLSLLITTDRNLNVLDYKFCHSIIKSRKKYSYDEVDNLLDSLNSASIPSELIYFSQFSAKVNGDRIAKGAIDFQKNEVHVFPPPKNSGLSPKIKIADPSTPARQLVSEMMIVYNNLIAEFCNNCNLPLPNRSQEPPDEEINLESDNDLDPRVLEFQFFSKLKKSEVSTKPKSHYGLGLSLYCQATSPIRRYLDLVAQRQVSSYLTTGEAYYNLEEMNELIDSLGSKLATAINISRERKRFWILEYLRFRRMQNKQIKGLVLKTDFKGSLVELDEVYSTFFVKKQLKLGETVNLELSVIDPQNDFIKLHV